MIFEEVTIKNFFRVRDATIKLSDQGLVLLTGENGAGKSTILEAIVWALWGKTVRGYTGDQVINRSIDKDCMVQLILNHEGGKYVVERYRNDRSYGNKLFFILHSDSGPVNLTEATATLTQKKITKFLGIEFDTYIRGPMVGQGKFKRFSEMTDAQRKEVLEDTLQIEILAKAKEEVKTRLTAIQGNLESEHWDRNNALQRLNAIAGDIDSLTESQKNFFKETLQSVARLSRETALQATEIDHLWSTLPEPVALEELEKVTDVVSTLYEKLKAHWDKILGNLSIEHIQLDTEIAHRKQDIEKIHKAEDDLTLLAHTASCPVCQQSVSAEHVDSCLGTLQDQRVKLEATLEALTGKLEAVDSRMEETTEEAAKSKERALKAKQEADDSLAYGQNQHSVRYDTLKEIDRLQSSLFDRRKTISEVKSKLKFDPFQHTIDENLQEKETLKFVVDGINSRISKIEDAINDLQFWSVGFGNSGLKSQILTTVTPYMNERAKFYSRHITYGDAEISFDTQTKLKSGELREKFDIVAVNKTGAENYEGSSGGEQGRIDLIINFTFSDLMAMRARKAYPQRFFDEPFESLDEAGIEAVLELLGLMVKECGTIFVVTHQPAMKSLFSKVIDVTKENGHSVFTEL